MTVFRIALFFFLYLPPTQAQIDPKVIYGEDNRKDVYEVTDKQWAQYAESTVALISTYKLFPKGSKFIELKSQKYGDSHSLCFDERFYDQITASYCSGSLIAKDIVLTAGHCIRDQSQCDNTAFVFDFSYKNSKDSPHLQPSENIYSCKELIVSEKNSISQLDFALIRLDREATQRTPLRLRESGEIHGDAELTVIGHPNGLPTKLTDKGIVLSNDQTHFFKTNLDTYTGNSGSAVLNSKTGVIEGVLVRGEQDFIFDFENKCRNSMVCQPGECRGEDVTRTSSILPYLDTI